ncbi:MAG: hypothetical protein R3F59_21915 [Myxococcota bacterium]
MEPTIRDDLDRLLADVRADPERLAQLRADPAIVLGTLRPTGGEHTRHAMRCGPVTFVCDTITCILTICADWNCTNHTAPNTYMCA